MFYLILFTMNLFSVNQVTQAYVVTKAYNGSNSTTRQALPTNEGDLSWKPAPDNKSFYFRYKGKGGLERTDIIDVDKILWAKVTPAKAMEKKLESAVVTINSAFVDTDGYVNPVGQDFLLRLAFNGYVGVSPEDSTYWKYGLVHVTANLTASNFYLKLAKSIAVNMSREASKFIKVFVTTDIDDSSDATEITVNSDITNTSTFSGTYVGVIVQTAEPDWILGLKQQKLMNFEMVPTTVAVLNSNGTYDDLVWGDVVYNDAKKTTGGGTVAEVGIEGTAGNIPWTTTLTNGKLAADYEYFFHGERGDQYRMMGWPDYVPTSYMADPSKEYDFVQIHYAYVGPNESCQKSEKDLVFLCPRAAGDSTATAPGALATAVIDIIDIADIVFENPLGSNITTDNDR